MPSRTTVPQAITPGAGRPASAMRAIWASMPSICQRDQARPSRIAAKPNRAISRSTAWLAVPAAERVFDMAFPSACTCATLPFRERCAGTRGR